MARLRRVLALLALCAGASLIGCGGSGAAAAEPDSESDDDWGDEVPETAGTEYTGSAIETLGITGPDTPWADMSEEDREFYMIGKVLPIMHELFARHDAQRYDGFSCETCHGNNMREVHFEMPVATIFRLPEPGSPGWSAMEATQGEAVRFMRDEVTPTMGTLLGMDDYTCFHCHTRR
ncbi:MAG: hypothetical protein KC593_09695 [Myxococcales bacterium]|nr:hypothetical protein [Myxococcales bacterium]